MKKTKTIFLPLCVITILAGCGGGDDISVKQGEVLAEPDQVQEEGVELIKNDIENLGSKFEGREVLTEAEMLEQKSAAVALGEDTAIAPGGRTPSSLNNLPEGVPNPLSEQSREQAKKVEFTEEEKEVAAQKAVEAKECTNSGGLYSSFTRECFPNAEAEKKARDESGESAPKVVEEILDTDSPKEVERKTCVNDGNTYNSITEECYQGVGKKVAE